MSVPRRMVLGISGATGIIYGIRLLERLRQAEVETHLVVSRAGELTRAHESDLSAAQMRSLASVSYRPGDVGAVIASGSFRTMGMIVAPCSVKTLGEIASGVTSNLLTRAADVTLKERRRLVLLVREAPLHLGHLRNMIAVTEAGGIIMPPVPAFYLRPRSVDELVDQTIARVLDLFDVDCPGVPRWGETQETNRPETAPQ